MPCNGIMGQLYLLWIWVKPIVKHQIESYKKSLISLFAVKDTSVTVLPLLYYPILPAVYYERNNRCSILSTRFKCTFFPTSLYSCHLHWHFLFAILLFFNGLVLYVCVCVMSALCLCIFVFIKTK